jgi:hypothetical protein
MNADERRLKSDHTSAAWLPCLGNLRASAFICGSLLLLITGCSDSSATTKPASMRDRQDAALKDPFGYSVDTRQQDSSGSGMFEFDREGLKRDTDHVLNP